MLEIAECKSWRSSQCKLASSAAEKEDYVIIEVEIEFSLALHVSLEPILLLSLARRCS